MNDTTLFFTDAHVEAEEDLRRFQALGNFIVEQRPTNIVQGGDFLSLDSLSFYDRNKRGKMEGRRFKKELDTGREAVNALMEPLNTLQSKLKMGKRKIYDPKRYWLLGNHEDRFYRYLEGNPELIGVVSITEGIGVEENGWEVIPYREYVYINGVGFTHVPMNGLNKPIGGVYALRKAALGHAQSIVYGHSHKLAYVTESRKGIVDEKTAVLNVGGFFEGVPEYAIGSDAVPNWWMGVVMINHRQGMNWDFQTISLETLLEEYL